MRNASILIFCLLPALVAAEEVNAAPEGAVRVALAPSRSGADSRHSAQPVGAAAGCTSEMDPQSLRELVSTEARRAGVDEKLALAILDQESSSGVNLNSPKGARGPMMLMPDTAAQYGVKDLCNPVENVRGSMLFLKDLVSEFQGNMMLVAAAYNAGSKRVYEAAGVPANSETVRYVAAVTNRYYGLGDLSARRSKGAAKNRGLQSAPENESSAVAKDRAPKDQEWIGGSVLYVSSDEGEGK